MGKFAFNIHEGRKIFFDRKLHDARPLTRVIKKPITGADISIIIPVFERKEVLTCVHYIVESLRASGVTAHLVIVDQSLTAAVREVIVAGLQVSSNAPELMSVLYHHDITLTISTAKNKGVELLRSRGRSWSKLGSLLAFIDSDVYVPRGIFSELFSSATMHPDIGAFGFPSVWLRDEEDLRYLLDAEYSLTSPPHKPEELIVKQGLPVEETTLLRVPAIHGCLFILRTAIFKKQGGFHPFFAMHGEHVELSARLNDSNQKLAYVMHLPILHDDRDTLQYSVMRNMPSRERFLLATLTVMMTRNNIFQESHASHEFMDMVRHIWLKNVGVTEEHIESAVRALFKLGKLVSDYKDKEIQQFYDHACKSLVAIDLDERTKQHLLEAVAYLRDNFTLLRTMLVDVPGRPHRPLYRIE